MSFPIVDSEKAIGEVVTRVVGGRRFSERYLDEADGNNVDMVRCEAAPSAGLTTFSTVNLHLFENWHRQVDTRIELVGVAPDDVVEFPNLLVMAALYVIKSGWAAGPGTIFEELLPELPRSTLQRKPG